MKLSRDYFFTLREDVKDEDSNSGNLLVRGGYIKKSSSGIYMFLPLGLKVKRKIEEIYHDKILRVSNINSFKERAEIIGANAWAIKNLPDTSNLKLEVLESLVYLVNNAEDSLKGGTHIQEANLFLETIVTKIIIALKYNIKVY